MPRGKWIDKKLATHFTLVHRQQNDPLIHDDSAPSMVLNPTQLPNASSLGKAKRLGDLASELGSDVQSLRANEGEAAEHGIFFDDTKYDYMQHMRDIGVGGTGAVFVEAEPLADPRYKGRGKEKCPSLDVALRRLNLEDKSGKLLDRDLLPSTNLQPLTYQAQQDVPDTIAGFQPCMDPRLREALEALEDEAYVGDDDDVFHELAKNAKEVSMYEFEDMYDEFDEEDGWESDHTAKPAKEYQEIQSQAGGDEAPNQMVTSIDNEEGPSQEWIKDFQKFKKQQKMEKKTAAPVASEMESSLWAATTNGGRKKRKGALTNPSAYSMTSSSLVRTEHMSILDSRFEKIDEEYSADMDDMGSVSMASTVSVVTGPTRADFDSMMDDFLGSYSSNGKKRSKEGKWKTGVEQLEEIRKELGPARIRPSVRS